MTFITALRHDGITPPCVLDGSVNGESFVAYVEQILVPTLQEGGVVIMDNFGSHKGNKMQSHPTAAARLLFVPPYSPDPSSRRSLS